jgi:hypothetical protein
MRGRGNTKQSALDALLKEKKTGLRQKSLEEDDEISYSEPSMQSFIEEDESEEERVPKKKRQPKAVKGSIEACM